jgi:hypothetical protein
MGATSIQDRRRTPAGDDVDAIPPQWTTVLQFADEFRAAAETLAN